MLVVRRLVALTSEIAVIKRNAPTSSAVVNSPIDSFTSTLSQQSRQQPSNSRSSDVIRINKSILLKRCASTNRSTSAGRQFYPFPYIGARKTNPQIVPTTIKESRKLAILFGWLMARDEHLEKYRNLYFQRGFDVLTVRADMRSIGLPNVGSTVLAEKVLTFLEDKGNEYTDIVAQGFSVGGYQFGEFLVKLKEAKESDAKAMQVFNKMRGMIFDSMVDLPGVPFAFSNLVAGNSPATPLLAKMIAVYLKVSPMTKYYATSSGVLHDMYLKCPALILVSKIDTVARVEDNAKAAEDLRKAGVEVTWKCWPDSQHVQHYQQHPSEYEAEIDHFLEKIGLK